MDRYYRQFDGLRALAVLAVITSHVYRHLPEWCFPFGTFGVQLFFVLSGFLITGILLRLKDDHAAGESLGFLLRRFYIRRSLRIFPLYYAAIVVAVLIPAYAAITRDLPWLLSYTVNWKVFLTERWLPYVSHFWTLAVEEQFYLVWPLLVLLVPTRWLPRLWWLLIAASFLSRLYMATQAWPYAPIMTATFTNLEALVSGSLLALLAKQERESQIALLCRVALPVAALGIAAVMIAGPWRLENTTARVVRDTALIGSCAAAGLVFVNRARRGFGGVMARLLEAPIMVYLGRISYGMYVIHNLLLRLIERRWAEFYVSMDRVVPYSGAVTAWCITVGITVALASLSWFVLEKPINDLKDRFPYRRVTSGADPSAKS
ncbi:acyltransferase family protein [bacterium]|nr:acyltransferase family protein [bacterium]